MTGCLCPIEHGPNALPHPTRSLGLRQPDWCQGAQHVGGADLVDRAATKVRDSVAVEGADPLCGVLLVLPGRSVLGVHPLGSLGEGWNRSADLAPLSNWIATVTGQLAVSECLLPSLSEADKAEAAQADVTPSALYDGAQQPAFRARWLDHKVEAVAIGIPARLAQPPDLDGGQGFLGVLASSAHCSVRPISITHIFPHIKCGM